MLDVLKDSESGDMLWQEGGHIMIIDGGASYFMVQRSYNMVIE